MTHNLLVIADAWSVRAVAAAAAPPPPFFWQRKTLKMLVCGRMDTVGVFNNILNINRVRVRPGARATPV